jgi:opacity protein-like surface antigen
MNTRLLSLGSLAAVLVIASPSIASEVAPVSDSATDTFNSEFVKSTNEAFTASTSAESLGTFEVKGRINPTFTENNSKTEIAQFDSYGYGYEKESGVYVGGNLGVFFPNFGDGLGDEVDDAAKTGFGGSIFGGYQFNKNWGVDLEFGLIGGGFDEDELNVNSLDDVDYSGWALMVNPRYTIPFTSNGSESKLSAFISGGIGIAKGEIDGTVNIDGKTVDFSDQSDTSFAWQIKGGLGYQFTDKLDGFVQLRYLSITEIDSDIDDSSLSFFSPEIGVKYSF